MLLNMKKWLNIPNTLSILRLMTIPVIVLLILHSTRHNYPILIIVYFLSVWLDFFDGYLARKLSQETEMGKILDPLADKLMVFSVVIALIIRSDFPIWLAVIIFSRDFLILGASLALFKKRHSVHPSILVGKITFGLLSSLIMIYILDLSPFIDLENMKHFFIVTSTCFLAGSWLEYYYIYKSAQCQRENHAR